MNMKDEDLPALRELESCILQVWDNHGEMNDYTVGRAYDAAYQFCRTLSRGGQPAPPPLKGLDLETYSAVEAVCKKTPEHRSGFIQRNVQRSASGAIDAAETHRVSARADPLSGTPHQNGRTPGLPDIYPRIRFEVNRRSQAAAAGWLAQAQLLKPVLHLFEVKVE